MKLNAKVSNAIHEYKKSRVGVGSTGTALIRDKNILCVYINPKIGSVQHLCWKLWGRK